MVPQLAKPHLSDTFRCDTGSVCLGKFTKTKTSLMQTPSKIHLKCTQLTVYTAIFSQPPFRPGAKSNVTHKKHPQIYKNTNQVAIISIFTIKIHLSLFCPVVVVSWPHHQPAKGEKMMKEFVVTAVFTVFFTLIAVSLPSLAQL